MYLYVNHSSEPISTPFITIRDLHTQVDLTLFTVCNLFIFMPSGKENVNLPLIKAIVFVVVDIYRLR